jgi:hypothetical protein
MSLKYQIIYTIKEVRSTIYYYQHNQVHRINGPAGIWTDGHLFWYQYGSRHRANNPAVTYNNTYNNTTEYYHRGKRYVTNIPI